jgi:hypothetical protein
MKPAWFKIVLMENKNNETFCKVYSKKRWVNFILRLSWENIGLLHESIISLLFEIDGSWNLLSKIYSIKKLGVSYRVIRWQFSEED